MDAKSQWADDWSSTENEYQETERFTPRAGLLVIAALSLGLWSGIGLVATLIFKHLW